MKVASALVTGVKPLPSLAEVAVRRAMESAEIKQAATVFLFLSWDMGYCAKAAVTAAARVAGCLQVHGCTGSGIFTDAGWVLKQSAAAALVMDHSINLADQSAINLSLTGCTTLPEKWPADRQRFGLLDNNAKVWANGRLSEQRQAEIPLSGLQHFQSLVTGLRPQCPPLLVNASKGYDVQLVDNKLAYDSLFTSLPPLHSKRAPIHRMAVQRRLGEPGIAIHSSNPDGSLTLGEKFEPGDSIIWSMRQSLNADKFIRADMAVAVDTFPAPDFALMFSCVGRGPDFFGDDDLDLCAVREAFPKMPIIGAYGCGQIGSIGGDNLLYNQSVLTLLLKESHV